MGVIIIIIIIIIIVTVISYVLFWFAVPSQLAT